jgi:hypothetical protein
MDFDQDIVGADFGDGHFFQVKAGGTVCCSKGLHFWAMK